MTGVAGGRGRHKAISGTKVELFNFDRLTDFREGRPESFCFGAHFAAFEGVCPAEELQKV